MRIAALLFVLFFSLSCRCEVGFPTISELDKQFKQTERHPFYDEFALTNHKKHFKTRQEVIEAYQKFLEKEGGKPLVMMESVFRPGSPHSDFLSFLVTDKKIYFYEIYKDGTKNLLREKLNKCTLTSRELEEIQRRITAVQDVKGKCKMVISEPNVWYFTIWDNGTYRVFATGNLIIRGYFSHHRGRDYFDCIESALELCHYVADITVKPEGKQEISKITKKIDACREANRILLE